MVSYEGREGVGLAGENQRHAAVDEELCRGVQGADRDEAPERPTPLSPGDVEGHGTPDGGASPLHVHPSGGEAPPGDLDEQGVQPVLHGAV